MLICCHYISINLQRLGLIEIPPDRFITETNTYQPLVNDSELNEVREVISKMDCIVHFELRMIAVTSFGYNFIQNVVKEK